MEVIQSVHEAYPEAIPGALHYALRGGQQSLPVIKYLLAHTPDGPMSRDRDCLPLHIAVSHQARLDCVKFLVEQYPEGVQMRDSDNRLPLHIAVEKFATLNVIKYLVSKYKTAMKLADYEIHSVVEEEGWLVHRGQRFHDLKCGLPLHIACKRRAPVKDIVGLNATRSVFNVCKGTDSEWGS